jgi:predicted nucleic acid-binding protein
MKILLDASPLSAISHPQASPEIVAWFFSHLRQGNQIIISELADYEVRRELIRAGKPQSLRRLDAFQRTLPVCPVSTSVLRRAAWIWAQARSHGKPSAHPKSLDADVIIAAQAEQLHAVLATSNAKHFSEFVDARDWQDIV